MLRAILAEKWIAATLLLVVAANPAFAGKIKVLFVDGQNNHNWKAMTPYMKAQMEKTGLFQIDVETSPPRAPRPPRNLSENQKAKAAEAAKKIRAEFQTKWDAFRPAFNDYDVIVSNYNGENWPEPVQRAFEKYMKSGGRFIVVHAADNSFPNWPEYNQMIGLGGWGGRTEKHGPYVYYNDEGNLVRNTQPGRGGSHGPQINYGKGIIFHTPMGHENGKSLQCLGFITTINRAAEWLATGKVTQALPKQFPTASQVSLAN